MRIRDNGVGLPEGFDLLTTTSLGLTLIKGLTGQLKGKFDIDYVNGVSITIKFPRETTVMAGYKPSNQSSGTSFDEVQFSH